MKGMFERGEDHCIFISGVLYTEVFLLSTFSILKLLKGISWKSSVAAGIMNVMGVILSLYFSYT